MSWIPLATPLRRHLLAAALAGTASLTPLAAQQPVPPRAPAIPAARTFRHAEEIRTAYHEASGYGSVELRPMRVSDAPDVTLTALFSYRGRRLTAPPTDVSVGLTVTDERPHFARARALAFALDGGRTLALGEMFRVVDSTHGEPRETLALRVPTATFLRLVNARRATGRVGDVTFVLEEAQLEALRDFASRMDPATHARLAAAAGAETRAHGFVFQKEAYEEGEVDRPAALIEFVRPSFPDVPQREPKYMIFGFVVDTAGRVDLATLVARATPEEAPYVEAIRRAAAQWRYRPAMKSGRPVRQIVRQTHQFIPNAEP